MLEAHDPPTGSRLTCDERRRFCDGDALLFSSLVQRYGNDVGRWARRYAESADDADDLVQESWTRAYVRRTTYGGGSFPAWLRVIVRSTAWRLGRGRGRRGGVWQERVRHHLLLEEDLRLHTAARLSDQEYRRRALRRAVCMLPRRQRRTVVLRVFQERSVRDTAAALKCAPGTVTATLAHAMRRLRRLMRDD